MYNFMSSGLTRLKRQWFGTPIPSEFKQDANGNMVPVEGGQTTDPGAQNMMNEILAALGSEGPIPLAGSLELLQPINAPAIKIYVTNEQINQGDDTTVIQFIDNSTGNVTNITLGGLIQTITNSIQNSITNNTVNNQVVNNITNNNGFTGELTVLTGATISTVGCTPTVNGTTSVITFNNGNITSVANG